MISDKTSLAIDLVTCQSSTSSRSQVTLQLPFGEEPRRTPTEGCVLQGTSSAPSNDSGGALGWSGSAQAIRPGKNLSAHPVGRGETGFWVKQMVVVVGSFGSDGSGCRCRPGRTSQSPCRPCRLLLVAHFFQASLRRANCMAAYAARTNTHDQLRPEVLENLGRMSSPDGGPHLAGPVCRNKRSQALRVGTAGPRHAQLALLI